MDVKLPKWLNASFIKTALESDENNNPIEIINFEIKNAVGKGNNYVCELYRIAVEFKFEKANDLFKKSLIVKCPVDGAGLCDVYKSLGVIKKEVLVYKKFIPMLCTLLGDENEYLTPKSYPSIEENVIVMDDLNIDGYKMINRSDQLDYDHTVIALKYLAKFHAASVKLLENKPELIKKFGEELIFRKDLIGDKRTILASGPIEVLKSVMSSWPETEKYVESISKMIETAYERLIECYRRNENEFNVLNHGDFWVTNILYKYNFIGKPIKAKLIDLQVVRYSNPAIDLIHLLYGSVNEEIITKKLKELIKIYVDELNKYLDKFNCDKRITYEELSNSIDSRQFHAFYVSITSLPVVLQDPDKLMPVKELSEDELRDLNNNPFENYLRSQKFKNIFLKRLQVFSGQSWFKNIKTAVIQKDT